ncbi:MAG TPA: hypothetical protein VNS63_01420, partial [Blastocatellia bacterium]|nr:hypothetical protein [Blastocatellia bacterium]
LAGVMPRGAMLYVQAADLSALMKRWLASSVRDQFYKSASFTAFSKSRIYLKLEDRKKDFETALGFGLDEDRLAELAGGVSAVGIYDIGNLELVLVTEVARARAVTTRLFKRAPQFSERQASDGVYYVRDVTTDGGRLNQQFCFGHVDGRLIITTTEGLMIRAMANAKSAGSDSLIAEVMATAQGSEGFGAHDATMWLDQARLNRNRHFNGYWIYDNVGDTAAEGLSSIESGLIDLRFTRDGVIEQRWFKLVDRARGSASKLTGEQASELMRFARVGAQLIELHAGGATEELTAAVSQALLGKLPEESWSPPEAPDRTRPSRNASTRGERYRNLDSRFDVDVDDEQAPGRKPGSDGRAPGAADSTRVEPPVFLTAISAILSSVSPSGYCELVRSKSDAATPFVGFERAVVIETRGTELDRARLEGAIAEELRTRFIVGGTVPALEWQGADSVRYVAQSLTEQGAAYAVSGNHLVLASSREFARDILRAASHPATQTEKIDGAIEFYGIVRIADAKPVFDKLMSKLDGRGKTSSADQDNDGDGSGDIKFFSENLSSFVAASGVREFRVKRERDGAMMLELLVYQTQE